MNTRRYNLRAAAASVAFGVAGMLLVAAPASARLKIQSFSAAPSTTRAGAHPDLDFEFAITSHQTDLNACDCTDAKDVTAHLPTGLIGNPHATPQCDIAQFASDQCPVDSQIGVTRAEVGSNFGQFAGFGSSFATPVFNLVPPPTEPGLLAFKAPLLNAPTFQVIGARTDSDYGLDVKVVSIEHFFPLLAFRQVIWGVPADPIHDSLRFGPGQLPLLLGNLGGRVPPLLCDQNLQPSTADPSTVFQICPLLFVGFPGGPVGTLSNYFHFPGQGPGHAVSSQSPTTPFTQNPTTCGLSSLATSLDVLSYDGRTTHADSSYPATTACDQLSFNPSLFAQPTTTQADSASGIDVDLKAPSFESPSAPSPSEIRGTTVTLPPGFTINPNAADGKTSCSDAAAQFGTTNQAQCPEFAKIGTLEIHSAVLPGTLPGAIYIGDPQPANRYRLIIAFDGFGVHVKLPGSVHPDPLTGQLVTSFQDLPQFPFEDFNLHFFGSERGVLATPTQCGTYPATTVFKPWDAALPDQTSTQFFTLDSGPNGTPCPGPQRPFNPGFRAAASANTAGAHTAFSIDLTRSDGDQFLSALNVTTPPGFSATLKGVPYCPESAIAAASNGSYSGFAEQANPSCPAASQVGTAVAGAGAGTHPYYAPGKVYLAGPYKSAPLSLVVITPAVAGPYDLGDVVVRAALHVDPTDAHVTAVSDPLPQILQGIPLRLRSVLVNLDRPNFALNPTDCNPLSVGAQVSGDQGAAANLSSPFQVANCWSLGFSPKLAMRLTGGTKRNGHPSLHSVLTQPAGQANLARAAVILPPTMQLDQSHLSAPCTEAQFAAAQCPAASVIGQATAVTPLLDQPLAGPVYLVNNPAHLLPDLVADLGGQVNIVLHGRIDSVHRRLRTTFELVPDAPITTFTLTLQGAGKGLLVNNTDLCLQRNVATVQLAGQNGKSADQSPALGVPCGKARHRRHLSRARAVR